MPQQTKSRAMLAAAEDALTQGIARMALYEDANSFKQSLLTTLESHPAFHDAVHALHAKSLNGLKPPKVQLPRIIVASGKIQAPRSEPLKGHAPRSKR